METIILITLLVMCVVIVFILADNSWFKWEKTDDEAYADDELETLTDDEDEIEDDFEEFGDMENDEEVAPCDVCEKENTVDVEEDTSAKQ